MDYRYARTPRAQRRARLNVEQLEGRDCPAAPSISLSTQQLSDGRVRAWGTVTDERPNNITVQIGGVISATTYTLVGGMFIWEGTASGPGTVTADCTDDENLPAPQATATLTNNAPTITLNVSYGAGKQVTLSGLVTDETAGGRTVTLSGQVNATVVTNADGTFTWTGDAAALGTVTAGTVDFWGATSNTAQVTLVSAAPVISNFSAVQGDGQNQWLLKGQVTDESFHGLEVRFGGLPSLSNSTTTVESNGWFYLFVTLTAGESGTVWCQTTDWWGQDSNVAEEFIASPGTPGAGGFGGSLTTR
jgi:hypothetical protein